MYICKCMSNCVFIYIHRPVHTYIHTHIHAHIHSWCMSVIFVCNINFYVKEQIWVPSLRLVTVT